jgi:hypothetical protein
LSAGPAHRPGAVRLTEALGARLSPELRAFAAHLGKAVAESIIRDIRAGRWGTIKQELEAGRGEPKDDEEN